MVKIMSKGCEVRFKVETNHWIDHRPTQLTTLLELFDAEYYRDLEMWVIEVIQDH